MRRMTQRGIRLTGALIAAGCLTAAPALAVADLPRVEMKHNAMGTIFSFILYGADSSADPEALRDAARQAFDAIDALEGRISTWRSGTETALINARAAERPVRAGASIFNLLLTAKKLYRETDGAFDPAVGPILDLWGFYRKEGHLPDQAEIDAARARAGLDKVILDIDEQTVRFKTAGMRLDFGGIGKGLALDMAAGMLREAGITRALLHGGTSTVVAIGTPPGTEGWKVTLESGGAVKTESGGMVLLCDESLSTSASSRKFFELEGKKYGHIIDPRTGWPAEGVQSVSVIAPRGMHSDALSTAFFVMGPEKARAYCQAHPGVRAIMTVSENGTETAIRMGFAEEARCHE
jgi:FAD:protein FMN transferase